MTGRWHDLKEGGRVFMDHVEYEEPRFPSGVRARGVGRVDDEPRALLVLLTDVPTDDDIRALHDWLAHRPARDALECAVCNGAGEVDCCCGGDTCVCGAETLPCPVCGNEERGQGGYLSCQCPAPARRELMEGKVFLRCDACGNAKIAPLESTDPPGTRIVVTNECDICDAAAGGFGECWYYDRQGHLLAPGEEGERTP